MAAPLHHGGRLAALAENSLAASESDSLEQLCRRTLALATDLTGADRGDILWQEDGALRGLTPNAPTGSPSVAGEEIALAMATLEPVRLGGTGPSPSGDGIRPGAPAGVAVPMLAAGAAVGGLAVSSGSGRSFDADDIAVLNILASQLAAVIAARQLAAENGRRAANQALVAELGRCALAGRSVAELAERAAADIRTVTAADTSRGLVNQPVAEHPGLTGQSLLQALRAGLAEGAPADSTLDAILAGAGIGAGPTADFVRSVAIVLIDAIRREETLLELAESRLRLQTVVENVPVILFTLNAEGVVQFAGGAGLARVGLRSDDQVGRSVRDLYAGRPEILRRFEAVLAGNPVSGTVTVPMLGTELEFRYEPMRDAAGNLSGVIGLAMDVSERKAAEVARRESDEKSRFLATMSHELRTPLNSVLGFAQLLKLGDHEALSERQSRYVGNIESSGRQLLDLINDVLDLSKVAAGQLEIAVEQLEVAPILAELIGRVQPMAEVKALKLTFECANGLSVVADRLRLTQIVNNLLSNAIKFTDHGRIDVRAETSAGWARIEVRDTGIGISEGDAVRVFEEFVQADPTLTRRRQGTGLGLALSRRLANLMGGEVSLAANPGGGSVFALTLPLAAGAFNAPRASYKALTPN